MTGVQTCALPIWNAADEEEYARNEKGRIGDDLLAELSRDIYLCAVGGGGGRP